jgi:hypothetical protein
MDEFRRRVGVSLVGVVNLVSLKAPVIQGRNILRSLDNPSREMLEFWSSHNL